MKRSDGHEQAAAPSNVETTGEFRAEPPPTPEPGFLDDFFHTDEYAVRRRRFGRKPRKAARDAAEAPWLPTGTDVRGAPMPQTVQLPLGPPQPGHPQLGPSQLGPPQTGHARLGPFQPGLPQSSPPQYVHPRLGSPQANQPGYPQPGPLPLGAAPPTGLPTIGPPPPMGLPQCGTAQAAPPQTAMTGPSEAAATVIDLVVPKPRTDETVVEPQDTPPAADEAPPLEDAPPAVDGDEADDPEPQDTPPASHAGDLEDEGTPEPQDTPPADRTGEWAYEDALESQDTPRVDDAGRPREEDVPEPKGELPPADAYDLGETEQDASPLGDADEREDEAVPEPAGGPVVDAAPVYTPPDHITTQPIGADGVRAQRREGSGGVAVVASPPKVGSADETGEEAPQETSGSETSTFTSVGREAETPEPKTPNIVPPADLPSDAVDTSLDAMVDMGLGEDVPEFTAAEPTGGTEGPAAWLTMFDAVMPDAVEHTSDRRVGSDPTVLETGAPGSTEPAMPDAPESTTRDGEASDTDGLTMVDASDTDGLTRADGGIASGLTVVDGGARDLAVSPFGGGAAATGEFAVVDGGAPQPALRQNKGSPPTELRPLAGLAPDASQLPAPKAPTLAPSSASPTAAQPPTSPPFPSPMPNFDPPRTPDGAGTAPRGAGIRRACGVIGAAAAAVIVAGMVVLVFDRPQKPARTAPCAGCSTHGAGGTATPTGPRFAYRTTDREIGYFEGAVTIVNHGRAPLRTWTLSFTYPGADVHNAWEAVLRRTGQDVVIANVAGARPIAPGESFDVQFGGTGRPAMPTNCRLNGDPCTFVH